MGLEDLGKQASKFVKENSDRVGDALKGEQAESVSDKVLDGAAGLANKLTGDKFADKVAETRDNLDGKIGNE